MWEDTQSDPAQILLALGRLDTTGLKKLDRSLGSYTSADTTKIEPSIYTKLVGIMQASATYPNIRFRSES